MSRTSENKIRSLLQKWLSGDTNLQEEKQLESLAKEDAFLAEAMDGYRQFPEGQHEQSLARLRAKLNGQTEQKRPVLFYLSRAAAVLVFLVIAGVGIDRFFSPDQAEIGQATETKDLTESEAFDQASIEEDNDEIEKTSAQKDLNSREENAVALNDAGPAESDVVSPSTSNSLSTKRKKPESKIQAAPEPTVATSPPPAVADADLSPPAQTIPAKPDDETEKPVHVRGSREGSTDYYVDGVRGQSAVHVADSKDSAQAVDVVIAADAPAAEPYAATEEVAQAKEVFENADSVYEIREQEKKVIAAGEKRKETESVQRQIQGLVQDANTQEPIPFANVLIPGTKEGTVTDIDGKFALNVTSSTQQLAVSYLGYEEQVVELGNSDQIEVLLNESSAVLSEVAVTGYSKKAKARKKQAKPKKGFKKYQKYIDKNRSYPEAAQTAGIKGEVIVEFVVGNDGRPTELKISQSLGYGCDEEALRLIREGPDWNGTGIRTTYKISFGQ